MGLQMGAENSDAPVNWEVVAESPPGIIEVEIRGTPPVDGGRDGLGFPAGG